MRLKSEHKKKAVTPIVLVDESQDLTNTVIISKMIKDNSSALKNNNSKVNHNAFAGGFKYRPQSKDKNKQINSIVNPNTLDKHTVYDEFGIINDSIGKKKYRDPPQETDQKAPGLRQGNPWLQADKRSNDLTNNPDYYQLSKLKEREQTAIHVKSSLEVINLDNIQAKIQAHRQAMKPLQEQYNVSRGKSAVVDAPAPLRFNYDVDRQLRQMKPDKVYQLVKQKQQAMERPQEEVLLEELWEEKKKQDPKLAEYDFKYQQYLLEKGAKKMIGSVVKDNLFTWDKYAREDDIKRRKQARQHKSKEKSYGQAIESRLLSKIQVPVNLSPSKEPQQSVVTADLGSKIASKDDKFIGKYIMAEIDADKRGTISKEQLADYLSQKEHLIKGYHIDLKWLHTDLDSFQTKRKGMLNQQEVIEFLATLNSVQHPELKLTDIPLGSTSKPQPQENQSNKMISSFFQEHSGIFERIFSLIDVSDDRLIRREEYIESIYLDADSNKILDKPVLKFNIIDKQINFRQIIAFALDDYRKEKNPKLKKSKQYITFQRFKEYFELPECLDLSKFDKTASDKLRKQKSSVEVDMFDIEQEYLQVLKDICATIPRVYQDYIVANDFVSIALKDPQVLALADELCRIQSVETGLPVENIASTLTRMHKQCDQYATWTTLKDYFSRRGRPLSWDYQLIQQKKAIRKQQLETATHKARNKIDPLKATQQERRPPFASTDQAKGFRTNSIDKYTVPEPFNITDERKKDKAQSKLMSTEQKEIEQLKNKFKAKPVNKDILISNPDLIQGKVAKNDQKSSNYNYENYQNDRIERLLKKAQEQHEQAQRLKQIKLMTEVKAKNVKIDLHKKMEDVIQEQKKDKQQKNKYKPTVPSVSNNLYPENPKQEGQKKIEKIKKNMGKQADAEKIKQALKKQVKDLAKQKNQQAKKLAEEQKQRQLQEKKERQKLQDNSFKPTINKHELSEAEQDALIKAKEQKECKKQEQIQKMIEIQNSKKQKRLNYVKKEIKLQLAGLEDQQIIDRLDEVDFQDLLLDQGDRLLFRKEYNFKEKTRKQIKQRFIGLAGRERAAMEAQQKRLAEQRRKKKEQKQSKIVQNKIEEAKEKKAEVSSSLNMQKQFHRSKALRRYRAIMQGKEPLSEYDAYSNMGDTGENQL